MNENTRHSLIRTNLLNVQRAAETVERKAESTREKELEMLKQEQEQVEKDLTAERLERVGTVSVEVEEFASGAQVRVVELMAGYPCAWYVKGNLYVAKRLEAGRVEAVLAAVYARLADLDFTHCEGQRRMYVEGKWDDLGYLAERVHRVYRSETGEAAA